MINLEWQKEIVEQLIKEDMEATAKDFIELVKELERIQSTFKVITNYEIHSIHQRLKQAS